MLKQQQQHGSQCMKHFSFLLEVSCELNLHNQILNSQEIINMMTHYTASVCVCVCFKAQIPLKENIYVYI